MTVPNPPNSLTSNVDNNYIYQIVLNWVKPTVDVNNPVTSYELTWDNGLGTTDIVLNSAITSTSYTMSSVVENPLIANKVYKFKLKSRNAIGLSTTYSNEISVRAAHAPDAPILANNAAVTGSNMVGLQWTAPSDGGSPITSYNINYKPVGGSSWIGIPGITTTSYTISSLTEGVEYLFVIQALNLVGYGSY